MEIRFDDLAGLEGAVSGEFGPWGAPFQEELIQDFADLSLVLYQG